MTTPSFKPPTPKYALNYASPMPKPRRRFRFGTGTAVLLALACPVLMGLVCFPGPHGGLVFIGPALLAAAFNPGDSLMFLFLIFSPVLCLLGGALAPQRAARIGLTLLGSMALFLMLLWFGSRSSFILISGMPLLFDLTLCVVVAWYRS